MSAKQFDTDANPSELQNTHSFSKIFGKEGQYQSACLKCKELGQLLVNVAQQPVYTRRPHVKGVVTNQGSYFARALLVTTSVVNLTKAETDQRGVCSLERFCKPECSTTACPGKTFRKPV